jgi:hypothetical protein
MKFLLDQDVHALTERFLRELGYTIRHSRGIGIISFN